MSVDVRTRNARDWLRYAQADLRAATQIINAPAGFEPYHAGFWAQQGAEKAIKAALIFANIPFEQTHNLNPDPYEHPTAAEAAQAVRDARAIFTAVCRGLQDRGMPIRFASNRPTQAKGQAGD